MGRLERRWAFEPRWASAQPSEQSEGCQHGTQISNHRNTDHLACSSTFRAFPCESGHSDIDKQSPDVLKVGHHGSAYSSSDAFLDAVRPRYAIISVGRHNHFGHPAPRTVAALERIGAIVYRTDEDGAVTVTVDSTYGVSGASQDVPSEKTT